MNFLPHNTGFVGYKRRIAIELVFLQCPQDTKHTRFLYIKEMPKHRIPLYDAHNGGIQCWLVIMQKPRQILFFFFGKV